MTKAKINTDVNEAMEKVKTERAMQAENNLAGAAVKPQILNPIGYLTPEERRMILSNRAENIRSEIYGQTDATVEEIRQCLLAHRNEVLKTGDNHNADHRLQAGSILGKFYSLLDRYVEANNLK